MASANIDTLVRSLYRRVETHNIEVFSLLSQPLPHLVGHHLRLSIVLQEFLHPVVNRFTRHTRLTVYRKHFFMNNICTETFCPRKTHNRTLFVGSVLLKYGHHFDYWNQPLNMRMRVCYLLSWSWTVLLPSDTDRKHITSITAVLLQFVTYLLPLPRIFYIDHNSFLPQHIRLSFINHPRIRSFISWILKASLNGT
jgi:hypothetical protein